MSPTKNQLVLHKQNKLRQPKPAKPELFLIQCEICKAMNPEMFFVNQDDLNIHLERVHKVINHD